MVFILSLFFFENMDSYFFFMYFMIRVHLEEFIYNLFELIYNLFDLIFSHKYF